VFAEKLNFLMSIIGISGGELAHAVSLDPSYISRLRSGKRSLPKGQRFLDDIAAYFATKVHTEYQIKLLSEAMSYAGEWPQEKEAAQRLIYDWLHTEQDSQRDTIMNILQGAVSSFLLDAVLSPDRDPDLSTIGSDVREYYYGCSGRQEAFLHFLAVALRAPAGQDMYLFTSESVEWLAGDGDFSASISTLLTEFAQKQRRLKIAHPIQQNVTDLIHRLQRWAPVYLTGFAEPYYYPKVRSDFFLRTLFVVPGTVAMVSGSLEGSSAESVTVIASEPRAVEAATMDMEYLLSLAKPLARVFTPGNHSGITELLKDFYNKKEPMLVIHDHLAPFPGTTPNSGADFPAEPDLQNYAVVESIIRSSPYTEVIAKPDLDVIRSGSIPIQLTELAPDGPRYLSKEEYVNNLDHTIRLLEKNRNYHILIVPQTFFNFYLCIKKGVGVLISKPDRNAATFFVEQSNVLEIVWEYANAVMKRVERTDKESALAELRELRDALAE